MLLTALFLAIGSGVHSSWILSQTGVLSALVVNGNPVYTGFLIFWSYIILLSPAMPIALYITLVPSTILYSFERWREGGNTPVFVYILSYCVCVLHVCVSIGLR